MQTAKRIERELKKLGTKEKAESLGKFFKTRKDAYGRGHAFGVTVPEQRTVAKEFADTELSEIAKLLNSEIHECRLTALIILVGQYKRGSEKDRGVIARFYLVHATCVNNWDLVDTSARYILGEHLLMRKRDVLYKLARSKNIWERRIAVVSTHAFIRAGDIRDALKLSEMLLVDKEDLMHKAVGWTLREVGKRSRPDLVRFLESHAGHMPRTALRYAIEHFSKAERKHFMLMK